MLDFSSAATAFSSQKPTEAAFFADVDVANYPTLPEKKLWIACLINSVNEYEAKLKTVSELFAQNGFVNIKHLWRIQEFRHETRSQGFKTICDHADFPYSSVIKKFDEIDKKYNFREIRWI